MDYYQRTILKIVLVVAMLTGTYIFGLVAFLTTR